ncbi:hypothetical protein CYQ88_04080 [Hydrogenovibrio sp. SC-1]|nr:hypothetical protein CYQ88_04080 [Hydrogenovibrio sp. SC-1]
MGNYSSCYRSGWVQSQREVSLIKWLVIMRNKRIKYITALLFMAIFTTASCTNHKQIKSGSSDMHHLRKAEMYEEFAKLSRENGNDRMVEYYSQEAQKERYGSCGLFDVALSIITLGFFDCE